MLLADIQETVHVQPSCTRGIVSSPQMKEPNRTWPPFPCCTAVSEGDHHLLVDTLSPRWGKCL